VKLLYKSSLALLCLLAGCRTINRGITETVLDRGETNEWRVRYGSHGHYGLTNATLADLEFAGWVEADGVRVQYQRGLDAQAQRIADETAGLLDRVEQHLGMTITTATTVHLLRFDEMPQFFDIELAVEPNEFPLPLFVRAGDESWQSILVQNRGYPYLLVHELVETSLGSRPTGGRVLPDVEWGALGLKTHVNNYTRWFRDGLANYAGYIAHRAFTEDIAGARHVVFREPVLHGRPFSALSEIGDELFAWPQSSRTGRERDYYNAALGLFLLIADEHGEQAIRDILAEIARRETVDGRDLVEITNQVIGTDVRQLAAGFEFPDPGLDLTHVTPALALNSGVEAREGMFVDALEPNGIGDEAGLVVKDVIIAVDSILVGNEFDFEQALFQARRRDSVLLTVLRREDGTLKITLPLRRPSEPEPAPGKRRNPLKKGRLELSGFPFFL
jgi:hypothetical protein